MRRVRACCGLILVVGAAALGVAAVLRGVSPQNFEQPWHQLFSQIPVWIEQAKSATLALEEELNSHWLVTLVTGIVIGSAVATILTQRAMTRSRLKTPIRSLELVEEDVWAIRDSERHLLYSGSLKDCEDWLDQNENLERIRATPPLLSAFIIVVRTPVAAAYMTLVAIGFPFRLFQALVLVSIAAIRGTHDAAQAELEAIFKTNQRLRRTWSWIFHDVPAPWARHPYIYE